MPDPIKLTIFNTNLAAGGGERFVQWLATNLDSSSFDISIILCEERIEYAIPSHVKTVILKPTRSSFLQRKLTSEIASCIDNMKSDVAITPLLYSGVLFAAGLKKSRHKVPWIARLGTVTPPQSRVQKFAFYRFRRLARLTHTVVQNTRQGADVLGSQVAYLKPRIIHVPNAATPGYVAANKASIELKREGILWAGRLEQAKRPDIFLDAVRQLARRMPVKAEMYGKGSLEGSLEKRIRDYGLSQCVSLCGHSENLYENMRKAALFVLTSDYEGMPNVILEAMNAGLPVVATDCDYGPRELITADTGRLVPAGDAHAIADAMSELLSCAELSVKLGDNAKRFVERYHSTDKIIQQWTKLFMDAAGQGDTL